MVSPSPTFVRVQVVQDRSPEQCQLEFLYGQNPGSGKFCSWRLQELESSIGSGGKATVHLARSKVTLKRFIRERTRWTLTGYLEDRSLRLIDLSRRQLICDDGSPAHGFRVVVKLRSSGRVDRIFVTPFRRSRKRDGHTSRHNLVDQNLEAPKGTFTKTTGG